MKLAVVTPRYGADVTGGAETAARLLATHLAARPGFTVEALTTCALDATTWADHYPARHTVLDGVGVRRFPVDRKRSADFDEQTDLVIRRGRRATEEQQRAWIDKQGPVSPASDRSHRADPTPTSSRSTRSSTTPRLPACRASRRGRSCTRPRTTRPILQLPLYRAVFGAAAGLAYWTEPERQLVEQRFAVASKPIVVVGLGVDAGRGRRHRRAHRARSRRAPVPALPRSRRRRQGRAAARRMLRPLQGPARRAAAARLRGFRRQRSPAAPRHPVRRTGRRSREVGPAARRIRTRLPERVRVVLDRAPGSVVGRARRRWSTAAAR